MQPQTSWRVPFGIVWLCTTTTFLAFNSAVPFITLYLQELGQDRIGAAGWAGAINASSLTIIAGMNVVWGAAADRWGAKSGLIRSQLFSVAGMAICGIAATAQQVLLGRLLQAIGGGPQSAALALTGALVPDRHLGMALGLMQTGQAVGAAVGPVVGGLLGDRVGYRTSFLACAVVITVVSGLAAVFVRELARPPRTTPRSSFFAGLADSFKVPLLRDLTLLVLVFQSAHQTVWTFVPLRIQEITPDPLLVGTYSGAALMGDAAGIAIGAATASVLATRVGPRYVLLGACASALTSTVLQLLTTAIPLVVLLRFVMGLSLGCILTVSRTRLVQAALPERRGSVLGVSQGVYALAMALGAVIGSTAIARFGLLGAFVAACVLFVSAAPWAFRAGRPSD